MKLLRIICLLTGTLYVLAAGAQPGPPDQLTFDAFRQIVRFNHPVMMQSELLIQSGESTVRAARGAFDPKIEGGLDQKFYKGTTYYDITNAQIKIPTILAAELKAGYDLSNGQYLNPDQTTPDDGLIYAGVSLPLLQGLLIDERRSVLQQAKAFRGFTIAEQGAMVNDLLLDAYSQYWTWWSAQEKVRIISEMTDLAEQRKQAVKSRAIEGDRPFIDTLEAHLQVQLRQQQLQEMRALEVKSRLTLSTFMWRSNGMENDPSPLLIEAGITSSARDLSGPYPEGLDTLALRFEQLVTSIAQNHPLALSYFYSLEALDAELRWKQQKLLPKLNVNYHFLNEPAGVAAGDDATRFSINNYKWGFDFSFPVFIREARGERELQLIKIRDKQLEREQKINELRNKARAAMAQIELLSSQYAIARENLANYETLFIAERTRFFNGESSLFLINQREMAYVDARNKVIDIALKIHLTEMELRWALNAFN
jgi:outer membrane protein TolC